MDSSQFTPDQLAQIQELMRSGALTSGDGRSPNRPRQLTDLRLLPTATDPRPLFLPSAESPRDQDVTKTFPYPRLLWSPEGEEITVYRASEHHERVNEGYSEVAPVRETVPTAVSVRDELAQLTPEERELVLEAQRQQRLRKLQDKIANLSDMDLETALLTVAQQVKRGPGRPKKAVNE